MSTDHPHRHAVNHAVVIHGAKDVRVEDRPVEAPGDGQVRVAVQLGGICGSDLSYFRYGAVGAFQVTAPMVLGHEIVGVIDELGRDVAGWGHQDRVVVDPSSPCRRCERCREGRFNVCEQPRFLGSASTTPHTDGGFSSFVIANRQNLVAVPPQTTSQLAVFAEPLAVTVHAIHRAGGVSGARILVVGAGPIGSLLCAAAHAGGAAEVVVADLDHTRLQRAVALGADRGVLVGEQDVGVGYDVVFEASGSGAAIADSLTRARRGGRVVLVGLPHSAPIPIPIALAVPREIDLLGSFRFNHAEFVDAVDLIVDGLDLLPLLTDTVRVDAAPAAFELAAQPSSMKVQLDFAEAAV